MERADRVHWVLEILGRCEETRQHLHVEQQLLRIRFSFKPTKPLRRRGLPAEVADIATVVSLFKEQLGLHFDEFCAERSCRLGAKGPSIVHKKWNKVHCQDESSGGCAPYVTSSSEAALQEFYQALTSEFHSSFFLTF